MSSTGRKPTVRLSAFDVTIEFATGEVGRFNRFWLRDNRPSAGERASLFRSFSVADLDLDLELTGATITGDATRITFSDGTTDEFPTAWLLQQHHRLSPEPGCVETWRSGHQVQPFPFDDVGPGRAGHLRLIEAVARFGVALVVDLPDGSATESLAALLGPIRETDFGRVFDIITEPQAFTPSQTDHGLDPHTDDPYRYTPAGISILHCVSPSTGGGESTIVDGFAIAEDMALTAPADFELLTTVPVDFAHRRAEAVDQGGDVHLLASAPIITVDRRSGRVDGIRFHERAMDTLPIDADLAERYYPALGRFARSARGQDYRWQRALAAGEAIVYDNQRVLHGRTPFDGSQSRRHLRLCTVDRDQVHSRLRRLREQFGTGTEGDRLPPGNLS